MTRPDEDPYAPPPSRPRLAFPDARPGRMPTQRSADSPRRARGSVSSGGQLLAALGAARRQDGAARAGAHAKAEAVRLGATTVVRLIRTLAHGLLRLFRVEGQRPSGSWDSRRAHDERALSRGTHQRYGLAAARVKPRALPARSSRDAGDPTTVSGPYPQPHPHPVEQLPHRPAECRDTRSTRHAVASFGI